MLVIAVFIACNYQLSIIMGFVNKSRSLCALLGAYTALFSITLPAMAEESNQAKLAESIAAISCDNVELGYDTYEGLGRLVECENILVSIGVEPLGLPVLFRAFEQEDGSVTVYAMDALAGVLSTHLMSKSAWAAKQARDNVRTQATADSENETDTATESEAFDNESLGQAPAQKYGRYGRILDMETRLDPVAVKITRFLRDDGLVTQIVKDVVGQIVYTKTHHEEFPLACDFKDERSKTEYSKHHALNGRVFEYEKTLTCGSEGLGTLKLFFKPFWDETADNGKAIPPHYLLAGVEAADEMPSSWPKRLVACNLNCDMVKTDSFFYDGEGTQACKSSCEDTPIGIIHFAYLRDGKGKLVMRDVEVVSGSDDSACL